MFHLTYTMMHGSTKLKRGAVSTYSWFSAPTLLRAFKCFKVIYETVVISPYEPLSRLRYTLANDTPSQFAFEKRRIVHTEQWRPV